jgi:hypothetical protein
MCVAIGCPERLPTPEILKSAEEANPDGGGIAWVNGEGSVSWVKNIDAKTMIEMIDAGKVKAPALIHFRITTSGGTRPELCHPFPISQKASTELTGRATSVLVHNGHWSGWSARALNVVLRHDKKVPEGYWSDSRALAYMAYHLGEQALRLVEHQKIATLNREGEIRLFGYFDEREGIHYSNLNWQRKAVSVEVYRGSSFEDWREKRDGRFATSYGCNDLRTSGGYRGIHDTRVMDSTLELTKAEQKYLDKVAKTIGTKLTSSEAKDILRRKKENKQTLSAEEKAYEWAFETSPKETHDMITAGLSIEEIVTILQQDEAAGLLHASN